MTRLAKMSQMEYNYTSSNQIVDHGATGIARGLSNSIGGAITMNDHTPHASALKVCSKCGEAKPTEQFSKTRGSKDGLRAYCKPCSSAEYKRWREENQEKRNAYMREWHQANLEHETRYARERYQNDEEYRRKVLEWQHNHRLAQPEKVREQERAAKRAKGYQNDQRRAQTTVARAIRRGLLPPAWSMVCDGCDEAQAAHWHHHKGYDRQYWLEVTPLCLDCHGKEHRVYD